MATTHLDSSGLVAHVLKIHEQFAQERARVIEAKWNENRTDFLGEFKPLWGQGEGEKWRSRVTAGITSQKVRALYAILLDVYLQGGGIPFRFKAHDAETDYDPADLDLAKQRVEQAFVRCHAERAFMANALIGCMLGKSYAKVTRESFRRTKVVPAIDLAKAAAIGIDPATVPRIPKTVTEEGDSWEYVSNWQMFTDPEAAFHCRNGSMTFQSDLISPYALRQKMGQAFFLDDVIESVLEVATKPRSQAPQSGTSDQSLPPYLRSLANRKRNIVYHEAWGRAPNELIRAFIRDQIKSKLGMDPDSLNARSDNRSLLNEDGRESYVHLCIADGQIVRFATVDESDNPFYQVDLETIPDEPIGRGVADNAKMGHDLVSMGLRSFVDNKAWSANVQMAMKRRLFTKTPDSMKPGGMWYLSEDAKSAAEAMQQIIVQDVGESLLSLIGVGEKYADWDTMMSKIEQGQLAGDKRTATEIVQQAKRSDSYTGSVIRNYDEMLTEPIAERFYLNMVSDPGVIGGKGDFACQALGFESYQENIATMQAITGMYQLFAQDPEARGEMNVRRIMESLLKRNRIEVATWLLTPAEKAQKQAAQLMAMGQKPQV